jgi:hypothetical protein
MDNNQTQQLFFNHIKSKLPVHFSFVDEMADVLKISNDSAYRRIRGETPLGLDELQVLCNKYHVSLDQLLHLQSNTVIFSGNMVDRHSFGFNNWLQDILKNLKLFKMLHNPHIYYFLKDIPVFHFMQFPELSAFKFFFWKRTIMGHPELARQRFAGEETDVETLELAKKIIEVYTQIPSTEIWNEESVHVTIRQIEFYRQADVFADKEILLKVYSQLEELLNHIEHQAEIGKKFLKDQLPGPGNAPYDIYMNEWLLGDNTVFVRADERQINALNYNGLNFISTEDKSFCDHVYNNLQNIINRSTHISLVGEKERSIFFNTLRGKIRDRLKSIN